MIASPNAVTSGFKQTEVGVIPEDWRTGKCSDVSALITVGIVIRPTQYYVEHGVPALRSANIREDGIVESDMVFISDKANALLAKSQVRAGDVLTVRTGYPGTSAVVPPSLSGANCIDILITRPKRQLVNADFLAAWINSPHGKWQILRKQGGLAQKHFNVGDMRDLVVAIPPTLAEQERIAEALGDADALIESLDGLVAKKRHLKQAAMQQLLTGKKRLPGFGVTDFRETEAGNLPIDWDVKPIGNIADVKTGPFGSALHESDYVDAGTPIITVGHLGERGITYDNLPLVSAADCKRLSAYKLEVGDVVFSRVGSVDRNALVRNEEDGWLFSGRLLRLRPDPNRIEPSYLSHHFHTEDFKNRVRTIAVGQTMPSLNTRLLSSVPVVLPSVAEQTEIAEVLSDMDTQIMATEAKLAKARQIKQGMMQELLTGRIRLV